MKYDQKNADQAVSNGKTCSSIANGSGVRTMYGNMDWFDVAEQPTDESMLPPEFLEAKKSAKNSVKRKSIGR